MFARFSFCSVSRSVAFYRFFRVVISIFVFSRSARFIFLSRLVLPLSSFDAFFCSRALCVVLFISHSSAGVFAYGFLLSVSIQFIQFAFANSRASPYFLGRASCKRCNFRIVHGGTGHDTRAKSRRCEGVKATHKKTSSSHYYYFGCHSLILLMQK